MRNNPLRTDHRQTVATHRPGGRPDTLSHVPSPPEPASAEATHGRRIARLDAIATSLALLSNRQLTEQLDNSTLIGSGIGGVSALFAVEDAPVFVKRIPLTDLERRPENVMSTSNLFRLPPFYQYGVGSTGFGVWRELAAHTMTTNWELSRRCESFPLLYHWRVLPGVSPPAVTSAERADIEQSVDYWSNSIAVHERLEALARASASVVLFLEYIPNNLRDWLSNQVTAADGDETIGIVDRQLESGVAFMNASGLFHFDAHFRNILTDGRRLYFTDFGLATSPRFELSEPEREFLSTTESHDRCYVDTQLVNWLVRAGADGPTAAAIIRRKAPTAEVMNDFYWKLHGESRTTPYPLDEIRRLRAS
jgi:serine/threonine protein kinase